MIKNFSKLLSIKEFLQLIIRLFFGGILIFLSYKENHNIWLSIILVLLLLHTELMRFTNKLACLNSENIKQLSKILFKKEN